MSRTNKYYDVREDRQKWRSLNILIGARRIGKTFSIIDYCCTELGERKFIYLRNTEKQIATCCSSFGNPFKKYNAVKGRNIFIKNTKECGYIYDGTDEDNPLLIGYAVALSTFQNLRGVSLDDVDIVFFDEFIEKRRLQFDQFNTFMDFYDTINDNREDEGRESLRVFMASNAQKLNSPILAGFNLISPIESMVTSGQKSYSRGKIWVSLPVAAISEMRKVMGLSQEIEGTAYYDETINNKFANDDFTGIGKKKLIEYHGFARIDDIYIYRHKSNGTLYCCSVPCSNVQQYSSQVNRLLLLAGLFPVLAAAYAENKLYFSDFTVKSKLFDILK